MGINQKFLILLLSIFVSAVAYARGEPPKRNYYDVLGVKPGATKQQLLEARNDLMMKWHPDHNKSDEAKERVIEINLAFEALSKTNTRAAYDFTPDPVVVQLRRPEPYSQEHLFETIEHVASPNEGLSVALLKRVYIIVLTQMGNPEFMGKEETRNKFYRDAYELIYRYVSDKQQPRVSVFATAAVGLHMLLKRNELPGISMFRALHETWKEQMRLTEDDSGRRYYLELLSISEAIAAHHGLPLKSALPNKPCVIDLTI